MWRNPSHTCARRVAMIRVDRASDERGDDLSAEHVAWVFRHSPASGAAFVVHVAIADSVNDQNEHEFWMRLAKLAVKARVSRPTAQRAIAWLVEHELLDCLDDDRRSGRPVRYRFVMPELPIIYETRPKGASPRARGVSESATPSRTTREGVHHSDAPCLTQEESKQNTSSLGARRRATSCPDPFVVDDGMRQWHAENTPTVDYRAETSQFVDHHRAKGSTFKDWRAAWRTWMRNAAKWGAQRSTGARAPAADPSMDYARKLMGQGS